MGEDPGQDPINNNVATAHGLAGLAPRHKSQNYQPNSGNSFELSLSRFEQQAKRGQGRGLTVSRSRSDGSLISHWNARATKADSQQGREG